MLLKIKLNTMSKQKTYTGISIDSSIMKCLDSERGLVPRSRFLEHLLRERYGGVKG